MRAIQEHYYGTMLSHVIASVFYLAIFCDGHVLLYDAENITSSSEKFDCIYLLNDVKSKYDRNSAGTVPYCRRLNITEDPIETTDKCENGGQIKDFVQLTKENVRPLELLKWGTNAEIAEKYAIFYYYNYSVSDLKENDGFVCRCTHPGIFGRFCQYQLTHEASSFEESYSSQINVRYNDPFEHQQFGDILCYTTLSCNSNLLCLDWRDVCDNTQQCENGSDEENCDKLEFNECEEDEYRCTNGMCIPEEYWLDSDNDCMDWSEEQITNLEVTLCPWKSDIIDCDEHICGSHRWSCGDGQCINWNHRLSYQTTSILQFGCWSMRNMNHMCELSLIRRAWTLPNGLCWILDERYDDPLLSMNDASLTSEEKCIYLIRCALSDGYELDCPCNRRNCSYIISGTCDTNKLHEYPKYPLIFPYIHIFFNVTDGSKNLMPILKVYGNVRCRGYFGSFDSFLNIKSSVILLASSDWDLIVCASKNIIQNISSSIKYDDDCWKNSRTFTGHAYAVYDGCKKTNKCMSQYRINDGWPDCIYQEDESDLIHRGDLCSRVRRHRFQCSIEYPTCFTVAALGNDIRQCPDNNDEYLYNHGRLKNDINCIKSNLAQCELLKDYIRNSTLIHNASINSNSNTNQRQYQYVARLPFQSYCDSIWNLPGHTDEFPQYCKNWICRQDQYQCQTGQCIPLDWVCDGEWDCTDASDEEAINTITHWSSHNEQLKDLEIRRIKCLVYYFRLPFAEFCNKTNEFPCLRSNVSNALDVKRNRPCIPYSKIGDEIEDCYNAYDEKNTFEDATGGMWGFSFQCTNTSFPYPLACADDLMQCQLIFCSHENYQTSNCSNAVDAVCIDNGRCVPNGRCNGIPDCSYGEDEYWCPPKDYYEQLIYRLNKIQINQKQKIFDKQLYPPLQLSTNTSPVLSQPLLLSFITTRRNLQNSNPSYAFWCNKGVSVISFNRTVCFCSPAYFGNKCQFFSDRISIITHLNLATWPSISTRSPILNITMPTLFKIKVNFLFNGHNIDHYEFHSNPTFEMNNYVKHKFYLLYSRSSQMLSHKKARFYNRTAIENNHPYSVHFDLYALLRNQSIPLMLGSWRYPVYFDFLPSFRLATILRFPNWLRNSSHNPCTNHTCNQNSTCKPIFNQNNSYFCACNNSFYGSDCSRYQISCNSHCSRESLCQPNDQSMISNTNNPFCICPLEHFGPRCFLKFEQCDSNPCLNNGSCAYTHESYSGDSFICICSKFFYGDRCQSRKVVIAIQMNVSNVHETPRASAIQFYDVNLISLQLVLEHQQVFHGFPSSIYYDHDHMIAPALGVLKAHYDSIQPKYFIIYLQTNTSLINTTSTLEHCPLASSLLENNDFSLVPDVFKYHNICRNNSKQFCFYDKNYLCICQWNHYGADCFLHDTQIDHCTKCFSNGKCVKGASDDDTNFICLCPYCYQGRQCEFSMHAFGFTLDSLRLDSSKAVRILYLIIVFLLFIVGCVNNLCSFVTFKRPAPRKFGVGNYLFINSSFSQISLLLLLFKFIEITFGITNIESCKTVSYLFSVCTRLTYWLASWVTIDRLFTVFFLTSTTLKRPHLAVGISLVTLLCLAGMHVHEIIHYTVIQRVSTNSLICVTNFDTYSISVYNRILTLVHYLLPFSIQVIAVTLLIVFAARRKMNITGKKLTFNQVLIKLFRIQKELYISPIIIVLSALPQAIMTFSLACTQLSVWQYHMLLITYLISFAPQILTFIIYVLPSPSYKKEFSEAILANTYLRWMFNTKSSTLTI